MNLMKNLLQNNYMEILRIHQTKRSVSTYAKQTIYINVTGKGRYF